MNIFRLLGDLAHFMSMIFIIRRVHAMKSCRGLSLKTRLIYVAVFMTRYIDLGFSFISWYNTSLKVFYIVTSWYIVFLITYQYRLVDDEVSTDTFPMSVVVSPAFILALIFNYSFSLMEILWSFSIFLEMFAILPQLHMLRHTGQAEALTRYYIISLGTYRGLYILNWIYRYFAEDVVDPIAVSAGVIQTILNFYFIYVYMQKYPREADIEALEHTRSHAGVLPPDVVPSNAPSIILPVQAGATKADRSDRDTARPKDVTGDTANETPSLSQQFEGSAHRTPTPLVVITEPSPDVSASSCGEQVLDLTATDAAHVALPLMKHEESGSKSVV